MEADIPKTGKNQFNYSERAAQTFNNSLRTRGVATEPPPVVSFYATVTQWDIFDAYMQVSLRVFFSILLVSCFMQSAALDSSDIL